MTKLVIEIDTTAALVRGEMAPGIYGNEDHIWTPEQERWIEGYVLRRIAEEVHDMVVGQPSIDFFRSEEMPEDIFGPLPQEDEENDDDDDEAYLHVAEATLGLADAILEGLTKAHVERGIPEPTQQETESRMAGKGFNLDAFLKPDECSFCRQHLDEGTASSGETMGNYHQACWENFVTEQETKYTVCTDCGQPFSDDNPRLRPGHDYHRSCVEAKRKPFSGAALLLK